MYVWAGVQVPAEVKSVRSPTGSCEMPNMDLYSNPPVLSTCSEPLSHAHSPKVTLLQTLSVRVKRSVWVRICSGRKKLHARVWVRASRRQSYLATYWERTVSTVVTYRIWMHLEAIIFKALLRNLNEVTERLPRGLFGMPIDKIKIRLQGCRKVEDLYVNKANSPVWQSQEMSGNRKEAILTATVRLETGSSLLYHKASRYERNAIFTLTTFRANVHCNRTLILSCPEPLTRLRSEASLLFPVFLIYLTASIFNS